MLFHFRDLTSGFFGKYVRHMCNDKDDTDYCLTDWFVYWLLAKDVLRLGRICIRIPVESRSSMMKDELPVESLVKLALFKGSPICQKRAEEWDLSGSQVAKLIKLTVWGDLVSIDRALNMNTEKLACEGFFNDFSNFVAPKLSGTVSERMKIFQMDFLMNDSFSMVDCDFPHEQLRTFIDNVLACGPNLEKMIITIYGQRFYSADDFGPYVRKIEKFNVKLKDETLSDLETNGCELIIATRAYFPSQTLDDAIKSGHDVMQMGVHCDDELSDGWETAISRKVPLKGKIFARHIFVPKPEMWAW